MEKFTKSNLKLGIMAGGQLAKMLIQEASKWDIITYVLDPDDTCPASGLASVFIRGSYLDFDSVYQFGKQVDLITFEIESVNTKALKKLQSEGVKILPDPCIIELIQDKGLQKSFYKDKGIPTLAFELFEDKQAILDCVAKQGLKFPFVQKLRKGGFDGRAVEMIKGHKDLDNLLEGPSIVEEKIELDKEIAIIVARNEKGQTRCFPTVEMVFNQKANLVEKLICPSSIGEKLSLQAQALAEKLINSLDMTGLLAVELFLDKKGKLLVNESAPRPHNSGHHTIESVVTSQFEQHLRAILNLPLGSTHLKMPAVMVNLLGDPEHEGPVVYEALSECMAIEGANIHIYGKKITRPFRKMGHVTIISSDLSDALEKADQVNNLIKVKS